MHYLGYDYVANGRSKRDGVRYWKCAVSRINFCSGSAKEIGPNRYQVLSTHNHDPNIPNPIITFKHCLKSRAAQETGSLRTIYSEEALRYHDAALQYPWSTAENLMRRARRDSVPPIPASLRELGDVFENGLLNRYFCCRERIMYKTCLRDSNGFYSVVFVCNELLDEVIRYGVTELHADGTFKVVPSNLGAKQLLVIHCMIQNHSIPILFALMQKKTKIAYNVIVEYLRSLAPTLRPTNIMTDFEPALRDSLLENFPEAVAHGCWFHHNQAVWKNVVKLGFLHLVNTNDIALKIIRMLMSLPLLPAMSMRLGFDELRLYSRRNNVNFESLFSYYERFWLDRMGTQFVSVYNCPRRTNNNVESFHNKLRLKFCSAHPNLWIFIEKLCDISKEYHVMIGQINNGRRPTRSLSNQFLANGRQIRDATAEYDLLLITHMDFLHRVSYSVGSYVNRQRNWVTNIENQNPQENINVRDIDNNFPVLDQNRLFEVESIDNAEDNELPQENINVRDIDNNFPVLDQNLENIDNAENNELPQQNPQENINVRDIDNNFLVLDRNRVFEDENIGNAEDNQLTQQNPHFEHTENDNGDEDDYSTPEDRDPDMQYMMDLEARRRQLELEEIPYVRVPAILPSLLNIEEMCIVCKDAEKTHALIPCGHKVVCEGCLNLLDPKRCPLCNFNFFNSLRVW